MTGPIIPSPSSVLQRVACRHVGPPRYLLTAFTSSGLIHVTAGVLAAISLSRFSARFFPPASGVAAIELSASFASSAEPAAAEAAVILSPTPPVIHRAVSVPANRPALTARELTVSRQGELPPTLPSDVETLEAVAQLTAVTCQPPEQAELPERVLSPPDEPVTDSEDHAQRKQPMVRTRTTDQTTPPAPETSRASIASAQSSGARTDVAVRKLFSPEPDYPPEALAAHLTGRVVLHVRIGADGCVERAVIHRSSGVPALDQSALAAVRQWRFEPARQGDTAVATDASVPIRFRIEEPR